LRVEQLQNLADLVALIEDEIKLGEGAMIIHTNTLTG